MTINCKKLGSYQFAASYIYSEHKHRHIEIDYIISGRCIMSFPSENVTLRQGECIIIASNTPHSFMVDGTQECKISQFEFETFIEDKELSFLLSGKAEPYYKMKNCSDIYETVRNLYHYKNLSNEYKDELFHLEFKKLMIFLLLNIKHQKETQNNTKKMLVKKVVSYIDENYEQEISLEEISKKNHISSSYLRRIFSSEMGFSAIDYITMLRLEKAKDLLKNSKFSVSDIAVHTGYNNVQYFSNMFKQKIGISPTQFRKQFII